VNDPLVTSAVQRDRRGGLLVERGEQVFRAAQIPSAFLACRRGKHDWPAGSHQASVDLLGDREHGRESTTIVAYARTGYAITVAPEGELNVSGEDSIEVGAHEHGSEILEPRSRRHDVARAIDARTSKAERAQTGREPLAAFALVASWRRYLRDGNLRGYRRRVACRDPRVRQSERTMRSERSGISAGDCGHE
jgi:hypothetical protein